LAEAARLAAEGLTFTHRDAERPAVAGVSFVAEPGERVAVIGPNGAGKSTLLTLLNGLESPQAGRVQVDDIEVGRGTLREVRRRVGILFQNPDDQLFCPTVREDVAFGPQQFGWPRERIDAAVESIVTRLDLEDLLAKSPLRLSQGERQRVALATVLVLEPRVLLLDEPTAMLDPRRRRLLIALLRDLRQTLIVATHDLDLALDLCPRSLLLNGGRVVARGASEEMLRDRSLLERNELELPLRLQPARMP
jgi:cobalt/nickel transport system ATP-binding protein